MTLARPKIVSAAWLMLPLAVRRKIRSEAGKRFIRFVPVALAALIASQITLAVLIGVTRVSAGAAAIVASMVGAAVSYLLSRWAWERKGRPSLLKETLPFWAISVAVWIVLALTSHFAGVWATSMGLGHWQRVAVVNGAYLTANCLTFITRFLIFHYVLFADRGAKARTARPARPGAGAGATGPAGAGGRAAAGSDDPDSLAYARAAAPSQGPGERGGSGRHR
jgi:putative flippase GtrA